LLKVGLTGGIACGKSVVGEMFAALGVHVIQSDVVAHELMQPGQTVYEEVVRRFGRGILNPDGSISRPKLAELAFGTPPGGSRIQELNQIVHPAVINKENAWMEEVAKEDPEGIAMVEAALILEAGAQKRFDRLVVVTCQPELRAERWARRTKTDLDAARQEIARRSAAQLPDEEKAKAADYVIENSGTLEKTRQQVREVYRKLRV
jgi:dephospho-CoA kinase